MTYSIDFKADGSAKLLPEAADRTNVLHGIQRCLSKKCASKGTPMDVVVMNDISVAWCSSRLWLRDITVATESR